MALHRAVIVFENFLEPSTVAHMNSVIDTIDSQQPFDSTMSAKAPSAAKGGQADSRRDRFSFLETDPVFLEVMAHPRILEIIREMCGGETAQGTGHRRDPRSLFLLRQSQLCLCVCVSHCLRASRLVATGPRIRHCHGSALGWTSKSPRRRTDRSRRVSRAKIASHFSMHLLHHRVTQ